MVVAIVHIDITWQMHKFKDAETLKSWWQANKGQGGSFYTVNCSKPLYTDLLFINQEIHSEGKLWCPWCGSGRYFEYSPGHEVYRCSICHVSKNEYHVRKCNGEN